MEFGLCTAVIMLALAVVYLLIKVLLMQKSADEICRAFSYRLANDTNTLIDISSRDTHMLRLAAESNRQLRELRAQRQRFQQGDFELKQAVTNISHDLRTPLTAISGYLELLGETDLTPKAREYCSVIAERTAALCDLTEELFRNTLLCAEADELQLELVNIKTVLEESITGFYQQLSSRNITPDLRLPDDAVIRRLDRNALRRIFDNLIGNAVKYSEGDLMISLTGDGKVSFVNTANTLDQVSVGRLFDRFYTVESAHNSVGIGLSVARLLTEKLGGSICAELHNGKLEISVNL